MGRDTVKVSSKRKVARDDAVDYEDHVEPVLDIKPRRYSGAINDDDQAELSDSDDDASDDNSVGAAPYYY